MSWNRISYSTKFILSHIYRKIVKEIEIYQSFSTQLQCSFSSLWLQKNL